jgi:hypothetical protein
MLRQGDVLLVLVPVRSVPKGLVPVPREAARVVLAHGEVTGHAHVLRDPGVCLLRREGVNLDERYLEVGAPADLTHEEHGTISVPAGRYRVTIQREWQGETSRAVED